MFSDGKLFYYTHNFKSVNKKCNTNINATETVNLIKEINENKN